VSDIEQLWHPDTPAANVFKKGDSKSFFWKNA